MGFGGFRTISLFPGGRMGPVRVASFGHKGPRERVSERVRVVGDKQARRASA
jgi:hypothetical protein